MSNIISLEYLAFFAAAAILTYVLPRVARPYFLLVASYAYFCYTPQNRALVPVLLGATLVTWAAGLAIGKSKNRVVRVLFLLLAIFTAAGILLFYKYWDLFDLGLVNLAGLFGQTVEPYSFDLVAPLGLSYFTFAALSYTIDVFKHRCKVEYNLLHYAMFVSFFPTLVTGPIERYPHLRPQIEKSRRFSYARSAGGLFRMGWGYVKKMVIADNLAKFVALAYGDCANMPGPVLAAAALLFSLQLYMDFSGCCDIALGAARILGYDLIENFQSPFGATTFGELWRRWHISMTGWFRDYVYIPLGGSRCHAARHLLNLIIVFVVSGLWHGADWRYLMWGLACGLISALAVVTRKPRAFLARYNPLYRIDGVRRWIQRGIVFLLFSFAMVFFASALYQADPYAVYAGMGRGWTGLADAWRQVSDTLVSCRIDGRLPVMLVCGTILILAVESNGRNVAQWIRKQNFVLRWTLYYGMGAAVLFFAVFGQSAFIYQNY